MAAVVGSPRIRKLESALIYATLTVLVLAFLFPVIWVLGLSLKTRAQVFTAPPQAPPVKIELGQTTDQVAAGLGQPDNVVKLGEKEIYVYKDLKITFLNGKVSDVE